MIKQEYHHGNLKKEFLDISFEFIKNNSVEDLTLKVLSDATGTSRSAIYRHFSSKDALIETMIEHAFKEFDDMVVLIFRDKEVPLIDRLFVALKTYIEFARENPNMYRLLFGEKFKHMRDEIINIKEEDCHGFGALRLTIEEGQKSGIIKPESSYKQTIVVWSSLHGLASLTNDGFMDVAEIYEDIYMEIFKGLLAALAVKDAKIVTNLPILEELLSPKEI